MAVNCLCPNFSIRFFFQFLRFEFLHFGGHFFFCFHDGIEYRVRTDLEKSLKMILVPENSWNSEKVQFVLELSLSFEKNLDNHKKSLKMIETVFLDAVRNKN